MKKIVYMFLLLLLLPGCKQNNGRNVGDQNKSIPSDSRINRDKRNEIWNGCYLYEEEPAEASNKQYYQTMLWFLEIHNDECKLLKSGFQTDDEYECDYERTGNGIRVIFLKEKYPPPYPLHKEGDALFQLKYDSQHKLGTYWDKEKPILSGDAFENGKECFIRQDCMKARKRLPHEANTR